MIDLLRENGGENIKVFGGGGGVIVPTEGRNSTYGRHPHLLAGRRRDDGPAGHDQRPRRRCDVDLSATGPRRALDAGWRP